MTDKTIRILGRIWFYTIFVVGGILILASGAIERGYFLYDLFCIIVMIWATFTFAFLLTFIILDLTPKKLKV